MESFTEKLWLRIFADHHRDSRESEAADKLMAIAHRSGAVGCETDAQGTAEFLVRHFYSTNGWTPEKVESYSLVDLAALIPEECGEPVGESVAGDSADSKAHSADSRSPRKSTPARANHDRLVAYLLAKHGYDTGSCENYEPVGVKPTARELHISPGSVSKFFAKNFGGHEKYKTACHHKRRLCERLAILNEDVPKYLLKVREDYTEDELPARSRGKAIEDDNDDDDDEPFNRSHLIH